MPPHPFHGHQRAATMGAGRGKIHSRAGPEVKGADDRERRRRMRLLTNLTGCPPHVTVPQGHQVEIVHARGWADFSARLATADVVLIECGNDLMYRVAAYYAMRPWLPKFLVAADLVLRKPLSWVARASALAKRGLLSQVDHFIHFFRDVAGYSEHFGITAERSSYVPFKVNTWGEVPSSLPHSEDYVYAAGLSLRDYHTFVRAVGDLGIPAAMSEYAFRNFERPRGTSAIRRESLPPNLTLLPDSGSHDDFLSALAHAKIVVVPTLKVSMCASGISTYLDAMYLGKSVIVSEGPGASDVLTDQAFLVPREDDAALREAIRTVWDDDRLRHRLGAAGHAYALSLGGKPEMVHRLIEESVAAKLGVSEQLEADGKPPDRRARANARWDARH
jgi:glycosyltransferase involved in cell wall biosynthesis